MEQKQFSHTSQVVDQYIELVRAINDEKVLLTGKQPSVFTHTYGCQQNMADTQITDGLFVKMGYTFAESSDEADVVLYNTCAVREGAEERVFGNVGELKHAKANNPDMVIGLYGCMVQQEHIVERIEKSYPFVDLIFGAGAMFQLPELLYQRLTKGNKVFQVDNPTIEIVEELPVHQENNIKAWLPVMTGCDNFCTYCVVPLVRGRERSRKPKAIIEQASAFVKQGFKEITLLGQNVNSYGKGLDEAITFTELVQKISEIHGDFQIRFLTSHPKDCSKELIDLIGKNSKLVKHLHLPVQSGSNKILTLMNRQYTVERYLSLIDYAKDNYPDIVFTSDIIVGFPGETYDNFKETLELVKKIDYNALYTYIYSVRNGTASSTMEDLVPLEEKKKWFKELLDLQNAISTKKHMEMVGNIYRVLADDTSKQRAGYLTGRSYSNVIVDFKAPIEQLGTFVTVKIIEAHHWAVVGEIV